MRHTLVHSLTSDDKPPSLFSLSANAVSLMRQSGIINAIESENWAYKNDCHCMVIHDNNWGSFRVL